MSAVCILTPILIGSWPAISAAVSAAAASLGFAVARPEKDEQETEEPGQNTVETVFPRSEVMGDQMGLSETMAIERGGVSVVFRRDERGTCSLCVSGPLSKAQLEQIGQEVVGRVVQQFAYHKLMTELKNRNYSIVEEQVQQDDSIRVRVRLKS